MVKTRDFVVAPGFLISVSPRLSDEHSNVLRGEAWARTVGHVQPEARVGAVGAPTTTGCSATGLRGAATAPGSVLTRLSTEVRGDTSGIVRPFGGKYRWEKWLFVFAHSKYKNYRIF